MKEYPITCVIPQPWQVTEEQEVTFQPDGSIALTGVPVPNMPGGNKFSTRVETLLAACPAGCQVGAGGRWTALQHPLGAAAAWATCM